jgi:hypothetical protein
MKTQEAEGQRRNSPAGAELLPPLPAPASRPAFTGIFDRGHLRIVRNNLQFSRCTRV